MDYYGKLYLLFYYLIFINFLALMAFAVDKYRARRNKWRIPEKSLMTLAIIGGSLGCFLGMHLFKHKKQKIKFFLGVPVIMILQIVLVYMFRTYF